MRAMMVKKRTMVIKGECQAQVQAVPVLPYVVHVHAVLACRDGVTEWVPDSRPTISYASASDGGEILCRSE